MTRICRKSEELSTDWTVFFPECHLLAGLQTSRCRMDRDRGWCLALVHLADLHFLDREKQQSQLARLLSPAELERFAAFRLEKRRREWLGGRLAIKQALLRLTGEDKDVRTISILPDEHGRPRLTMSRPAPVPSISISHSGTSAVAMASRARSCGVDVQEIVPRIERLADHIGEPAELALLAGAIAGANNAARLTMLWAAKEAVKKSLLPDQPAFFNATRLREIDMDSTGSAVFRLACTLHGMRATGATIRIHRFDGYILAFTEQDHA